MTVREELQNRRRTLAAEIDAIEKKLSSLPDGELDREGESDSDDSAFVASLRNRGLIPNE